MMATERQSYDGRYATTTIILNGTLIFNDKSFFMKYNKNKEILKKTANNINCLIQYIKGGVNVKNYIKNFPIEEVTKLAGEVEVRSGEVEIGRAHV